MGLFRFGKTPGRFSFAAQNHPGPGPGPGEIGTGSLRRKAQLLGYRPDLEIIPLRGNLDTRIRKMETQGLAGSSWRRPGHRLGWNHLISEYWNPKCLPAVGQGALALEIGRRFSSGKIDSFLHHEESALCPGPSGPFSVDWKGVARFLWPAWPGPGGAFVADGINRRSEREDYFQGSTGRGRSGTRQSWDVPSRTSAGVGRPEVLDQVYGSNRDEG